MASHFDRWEKDSFFSATESADRMESTYWTWVHSMKDTSGLWNSDELHRDLHTALGTSKSQDELRDAVLLVFVDKQDFHNAMSAAEIIDKLSLHCVRHCHELIFSINLPLNFHTPCH